VTPSPRTGAIQLALAALAIVLALVAGTPADAAAVSRATFAAKAAQAPSKKAAKQVVVRFKVRGLARRVKRATLVLHGRRVARASVRVRKVGKRPTVVGHWAPRKRSQKLRSKAQRRTVRIDVTRAVKGNGDVALALTSSDRGALAAAAGEAKLDIVLASGAGSAGGGSSRSRPRRARRPPRRRRVSSSSSSRPRPRRRRPLRRPGQLVSTSKLAPARRHDAPGRDRHRHLGLAGGARRAPPQRRGLGRCQAGRRRLGGARDRQPGLRPRRPDDGRRAGLRADRRRRLP
jgi:hypothetical protein